MTRKALARRIADSYLTSQQRCYTNLRLGALARVEHVSPQVEKSPTQDDGFTREAKAHDTLVPQARDRET